MGVSYVRYRRPKEHSINTWKSGQNIPPIVLLPNVLISMRKNIAKKIRAAPTSQNTMFLRGTEGENEQWWPYKQFVMCATEMLNMQCTWCCNVTAFVRADIYGIPLCFGGPYRCYTRSDENMIPRYDALDILITKISMWWYRFCNYAVENKQRILVEKCFLAYLEHSDHVFRSCRIEYGIPSGVHERVKNRGSDGVKRMILHNPWCPSFFMDNTRYFREEGHKTNPVVVFINRFQLETDDIIDSLNLKQCEIKNTLYPSNNVATLVEWFSEMIRAVKSDDTVNFDKFVDELTNDIVSLGSSKACKHCQEMKKIYLDNGKSLDTERMSEEMKERFAELYAPENRLPLPIHYSDMSNYFVTKDEVDTAAAV